MGRILVPYFHQELLHKKAGQFTVNNDYTVEIDCRKMPQELQEEFARVLGEPLFGEERRILSSRMHTTTIGEANRSGRAHSIPRLTICILIVGTRGDVQPFIAIGRKLMVCPISSPPMQIQELAYQINSSWLARIT